MLAVGERVRDGNNISASWMKKALVFFLKELLASRLVESEWCVLCVCHGSELAGWLRASGLCVCVCV